ncbi:MAG TPA: alpha/beta hydrolase [Ideonella sp.]|nr:alpha/beta hydrolase [Ideonella sp.]
MTLVTAPTLPSAPLDPAFAGFLAQAAAQGQPPLETLPLDVARQVYRDINAALSLPTPEIGEVTGRLIEGPGGPLALRIYKPAGVGAERPVLLFLHGGGWVIGDLDTHDGICRTLCRATAAIVVAVDYRRAPEHVFPAALDDAEAALTWLAAHAGELGGDVSRLALAGDSAGGQLAATLALRAAGSVPLRALGLIYPAAQHYSAPSPSYLENGEGKFLTLTAMKWFMDCYMGTSGDAREHPDFRLLGSSRLATLPPTWLATMGHDPLRDEGHALALEIAAAGVAVAHHHEPQAIHACLHMTALSGCGSRVMQALAAWLRVQQA